MVDLPFATSPEDKALAARIASDVRASGAGAAARLVRSLTAPWSRLRDRMAAADCRAAREAGDGSVW